AFPAPRPAPARGRLVRRAGDDRHPAGGAAARAGGGRAGAPPGGGRGAARRPGDLRLAVRALPARPHDRPRRTVTLEGAGRPVYAGDRPSYDTAAQQQQDEPCTISALMALSPRDEPGSAGGFSELDEELASARDSLLRFADAE